MKRLSCKEDNYIPNRKSWYKLSEDWENEIGTVPKHKTKPIKLNFSTKTYSIMKANSYIIAS